MNWKRLLASRSVSAAVGRTEISNFALRINSVVDLSKMFLGHPPGRLLIDTDRSGNLVPEHDVFREAILCQLRRKAVNPREAGKDPQTGPWTIRIRRSKPVAK
jgi:hypothetical protein